MDPSSIKQDPIVNIEVSSFFHVMVTFFMVDSFQNIMDVVMHYSHSVELFFCSGGGEFAVVIKVYGAWIEATETSVGGKFVGGRQ